MRPTFTAVRDRVEPGKVSAYATLALRRQLERDGLDDLIGELVEVNGPLEADAVARFVDEWRREGGAGSDPGR